MILLLKGLLVVFGILFFLASMNNYVHRKFNETFGVLWVIVSLLIFVMGIVSLQADHIYEVAFALLLFICFLALFLLFKISKLVSVLMMKNQELAMQVSLLNQENEKILYKVGKLTDEEDTVCH